MASRPSPQLKLGVLYLFVWLVAAAQQQQPFVEGTTDTPNEHVCPADDAHKNEKAEEFRYEHKVSPNKKGTTCSFSLPPPLLPSTPPQPPFFCFLTCCTFGIKSHLFSVLTSFLILFLVGLDRTQNNLSFAMICYREALDINPEDKVALLGMSELYFSFGNLPGAELSIRELLRLDSKNADALLLLADLFRYRDDQKYHETGKRVMNGKIVHYYKEAMESDPSDDRASYGLGTYYSSLGDTEMAVLTFEDGLSLSPESYLLLLGIADTYKDMRQYETCINFAGRAARLEREQARPLAVLGECAFYSNESERAVRAFQRAIKIDPSSDHYLVLLINALRSATSMNLDEVLSILHGIDIEPYVEFTREAYHVFLEEVEQDKRKVEL